MEIIPAIDIRGGMCVRLTQGDYSQETVFDEDPLNVVDRWLISGANSIHIVDLDGARSGLAVNQSLIRRMVNSSSDLNIQLGGGIRSSEIVEEYINLGVNRLILGTAAVKDQKLVQWQIDTWGTESLVISIDARNGFVEIDGWTKNSGILASELIAQMMNLGVQNFLYTDILKDGMLTEPNYKFIEELLNKFDIKLQAAGGISSLAHLEKLNELGVDYAIVGKAIYTGRIDLSQATKIYNNGDE
ncbi:MAG: 1-(5-phosphoribosyl)-5-[(5-phosphoribosylamino)methylideneamino]imidazole-4-carboxamide isomerase [Chloroflexi bacterium]|nr:1-(5-phosphoribosyl)-5-[(5-phosphoribosylamino)methylideneamino]imidazole-4-carboxamide isomerase [Chloroflexota bacterium]